MKLLAALFVIAMAGSAKAQECARAEVLEQQLAQATVEPYVGRLTPARPDQDWTIGSQGGGGFTIPAPRLGEILAFREATATTSCGLDISWRSYWNGARIISAGVFKVAPTKASPAPRRSATFRNASFRITPDPASQTAWLSVTAGGRTYDHLVDFPATAIATYPIMHTDAVWLQLMGVRADGALVFADFSANLPK